MRAVLISVILTLIGWFDTGVCWLLYYTGTARWYIRSRLKDKVTILLYHEIGGGGVVEGAAVDPRRFERQMRHISANYVCIPLGRLHRYLAGEEDLPPCSLIVTFDGGFRGNHTNALPVLRRYEVPATVYLVTDYIDEGAVPWTFVTQYMVRTTKHRRVSVDLPGFRGDFDLASADDRRSCSFRINSHLIGLDPAQRSGALSLLSSTFEVIVDNIPGDLFLTHDQIREMERSGLIEFGSHTLSHPDLTGIAAGEARREIELSKMRLEELATGPVSSFCYPYGFYSEDTVEMAREAGYRSATTTIHGLNERDANPFELRRIGARNVPLFRFAVEVCGLYRPGWLLAFLGGRRRAVDTQPSER
jgi:peptidoglycan/xylan/chitin deacetylase (PgdA/CDA1 family)